MAKELDEINQQLLEKLNSSGKIYLTHTKVDGKYGIRMVIGQNQRANDSCREGVELNSGND